MREILKQSVYSLLSLLLLYPLSGYTAIECTDNTYNSTHNLIFNNIAKTYNILVSPERQNEIIGYLNQTVDAPINGVMLKIFGIDQTEIEQYPNNIRNVLEILSETKMEPDQKLNKKAWDLLNSIRYFSSNQAMGECYKIVVLRAENDFAWAFSMGCTIYITSGLLNKLDENEIKAIIAHEMSHGAHGHMIKSLLSYVDSGSTFLETLIFEEIDSLIFGQNGPCLKSYVLKYANINTLSELLLSELDMFIDIHGAHAPNIELEADVAAVKILKKARINPNVLITGMLKIMGITDLKELNTIEELTDSFRDYPSMQERIEAISKAAKK